MDTILYSDILSELAVAADKFSISSEISEDIEEDFSTIREVVDISSWSQNVDGVVKDVPQILKELAQANEKGDRQKCINSIAMLRCAISDIESAFSNAMDSMENIIAAIKDDE